MKFTLHHTLPFYYVVILALILVPLQMTYHFSTSLLQVQIIVVQSELIVVFVAANRTVEPIESVRPEHWSTLLLSHNVARSLACRALCHDAYDTGMMLPCYLAGAMSPSYFLFR